MVLKISFEQIGDMSEKYVTYVFTQEHITHANCTTGMISKLLHVSYIHIHTG